MLRGEIQFLRPELDGGLALLVLLGGRGAFWSAVRCHVRIFPRAAQQEKCYVTPLCCSRVPVMPEVHFWVFTLPVQHQWSLSSIDPLCKK